ncbi:MAG: hypothetical protein RIC35_05500 [Marinoscillum sp.]
MGSHSHYWWAQAAIAAVTGANDVKANGYLTKTQVASVRDINLSEEITRFTSVVKESLAELANYGISETQGHIAPQQSSRPIDVTLSHSGSYLLPGVRTCASYYELNPKVYAYGTSY